MLPPRMLPTAEIEAAALTLLAETLPEPPRALLITKLFRLPTVCRLELVTLALRVVPDNNAALAPPPDALTLLNSPPSPIK